MFPYTGRIVTALVLLCWGWVATASPEVSWPVQPSRLALATPHGNLHITASEYVYEAVLKLDDDGIEPRVVGLLNIPYAFEMPDFHAALVSVSKGNEVCPIAYQWVRIDKSGYSVTPEFGSCSDQIQVKAAGQVLTVLTPNSSRPDRIDTYTYDGKDVKRRPSTKNILLP